MSIEDETNPTHVYERKGNYIIDLRAHNRLKSDEKTVTIIVTDQYEKDMKLLVPIFLIFLLMSFASCKKCRTCQC